MAKANDPMGGEAGLVLAQTLRYRTGRRDDTLAAYVEALYYNRDNPDTWRELIEYASSAPHIPVLVDLFAISPLAVRPTLLAVLVSIADGRDRMRNLEPAKGPLLRATLLDLAENQADRVSIAYLAADAGHRAERPAT
ncbi:hypothetical protein ACGFJC_39805 [Nonomuraea fuscirosea]|uniref:hypothetical protein n=1 Tax=Nonomuraea fuscirosea TaxID=1291556 RepID=UPI003711D604